VIDLYVKSHPMSVVPKTKAEPKVDLDAELRTCIKVTFMLAKLKSHGKLSDDQKKALETMKDGDSDLLLNLVKKSSDSVYEGGMTFSVFHDSIEGMYKSQLELDAKYEEDKAKAKAAKAEEAEKKAIVEAAKAAAKAEKAEAAEAKKAEE